MKKFETVVLRGFSNHFYRGNKEFIKFDLSFSEDLIISLTSDEFVKKFKIQNSNHN